MTSKKVNRSLLLRVTNLIAVFRMGEEIFALHDLCTHGHARLSEGFVENGCVECPLHQGLVDIRTGAPRARLSWKRSARIRFASTRAASRSMSNEAYVIVGAGHAARRAAETLRA